MPRMLKVIQWVFVILILAMVGYRAIGLCAYSWFMHRLYSPEGLGYGLAEYVKAKGSLPPTLRDMRTWQEGKDRGEPWSMCIKPYQYKRMVIHGRQYGVAMVSYRDERVSFTDADITALARSGKRTLRRGDDDLIVVPGPAVRR